MGRYGGIHEGLPAKYEKFIIPSCLLGSCLYEHKIGFVQLIQIRMSKNFYLPNPFPILFCPVLSLLLYLVIRVNYAGVNLGESVF